MSIEAGIHPNAGGGGGRKPRLIPAILTLILIACSTIMGCNGHNNPMDATGSLDIGRSGQSFESGTAWGTAYGTDCAASFWAAPVPSGEYSFGGDIVGKDWDLSEIEILITQAFVKDNNYQFQSEITLELQDDEGDPILSSTFNGGGATYNHLCQHPVVEVTYSREPEAEEGVMRVHVVWSELNISYSPDNFDLYYRYIEFEVNGEDGIVTPPDVDEIEWLDFSDPDYDDIQPDICVIPSDNDLVVLYLADDEVRMGKHVYEDMDDPSDWDGGDCMSSSAYPKWGPRCDGGRFSFDGGTCTPEGGLVFVWSELVDDEDYDDWQVYANEWDAGNSWTGAYRVSSPGIGEDEINYLPQVDILPQSSLIGEAVIVWDNARWDSREEEFTDYRVMMTATPYQQSSQEFLDYSFDCRASDVSCYQRRWQGDDMGEEEEWFAVSFQGYAPALECWTVGAMSYILTDEDTHYDFTPAYDSYVPYSEGQWSFDYPGTAPSIALYYPFNPTTANKGFIMSYVDTDGGNDFDGCTTSGNIY